MDTAYNQTAFALLPLSFVGFLVNWSVFYSYIRLSSMKHSFGYLSANQAFADAMHSTTFLLYFCPMVLLFCAVWTPFKYKKLFNINNTCVVILMIWVVVGTIDVLIYEYFCHVSYSEQSHSFVFYETVECQFIGWYVDFIKNSITVTIIMILDILTLVGVRQARLSISIKKDNCAISTREGRFLKQTVSQGTVFMLELLTYFVVPKLTEDIVVIFFSTSFAYVAVHVLDGYANW
ncbi:hypothetical protein GCK72_020020 [Caenorhabditis remanei]|uniref:7TM GPCR serpentine receptor class x (Srx) domain-containing protein n=1 Tax=Caenorhabditis remanei TaxID=31234 RepID=A0A6A5GFL8_CAERE|nr:hypothetical protein GCK72_020020 [Caenorhabditis remanei]KAF1753463.1 hypothetical protein GCK72_020020 [Caenorhabditis remanei]